MNDSPDEPLVPDRPRPVRIVDVAEAAGVSAITVSRTLKSPEKVSRKTRDRVAEAIDRLGYVVNPIASWLRCGQSSIVTVFVASLQNPHHAARVQGIADAFEGSPYQLMFTQTGFSGGVDRGVFETLRLLRPAGAILTSSTVEHDALVREMSTLDAPLVQIGDIASPHGLRVQVSSREAGRLMGDHLAAIGRRAIVFCGHTLGHGARRLDGLREGLAAHGQSLRLVLPIEGTQNIGDGSWALGEILETVPECDAIFFGSDLMAMGALIEAGIRGVNVPGRIAIAGYGDLDFACNLDPPLTTIRLSDYDSGRIAGQMLLARLQTGRPAEEIRIQQVSLQIRQSTAP